MAVKSLSARPAHTFIGACSKIYTITWLCMIEHACRTIMEVDHLMTLPPMAKDAPEVVLGPRQKSRVEHGG